MVAKNGLKSMHDNLLEFAVINFRDILVNKYEEITTSKRTIFPPSLLEKIIFKSKEMKWLINLSLFFDFFPYRDKLSWKNLNLMLYPKVSLNDVMDEHHLTEIGGLDYPIKSLVIYLNNISEKGMKDLCTMGSVMEDLVLYYNSRTTMEFLDAPFPKLRKLHLVFADREETPYPNNPMHLDLTRFSDTLEELKLQYECIDDFTAKSIASLKKLKTLSLPFTNILNCDEFFSEIVGSMDQLRTLDVRYTNIKDRRLNKELPSQVFPLIPKLSSLERFETDGFICGTEHLKKVIGIRRLKRFGMQEEEMEYMNRYLKYDEARPLADEILGAYPETLLSYAETYIDDVYRPALILKEILDTLPIVRNDQTEYRTRIENVLLRSCEKIDFCEAVGSTLMKYLKSGGATLSLKTNILKSVCSFHDNGNHLIENFEDAVMRTSFTILFKDPSISRTMLEIVEKNLNKGLSRKMLQSLLIHSYSHLHDVANELGLNDVCKNAIEQSEFDQEAMNATKTLLKHFVDGLPIQL